MEYKKSSSARLRTKIGSIYNYSYNETNTVLNDISSVLFILKLTGLLPFHQTISNYEMGPPTRLHYIYLIIIHVLFHSTTIYNLHNLFSDGSHQILYSYRGTENANYWIDIVLCIVTFTTTLIVCLKNTKVFIQIFNDILKMDEDIKHNFSAKISNNCGFAAKFIILILLFQWYIMTLKVLGTDGSLTIPSYFLIGFYSVQNGLSSVFIVYISMLMRIVAVRFEYLNSIINAYTYRAQQNEMQSRIRHLHSGIILSQPPLENFQNDSLFAFRMHIKVMGLYKVINDSCSIILVVYMSYAFYSITTTTYHLFVQMTTHRDVSSTVIQISFALLFLNTIMLALLSRCADQASDQANETSKLLAQVYAKTKDDQIAIDKFLTKSIKQEVQFTAYGFFVIDIATLFKIFSAVTTYLVILIQFKQLEESKLSNSRANTK